jgi:hypothetical protein
MSFNRVNEVIASVDLIDQSRLNIFLKATGEAIGCIIINQDEFNYTAVATNGAKEIYNESEFAARWLILKANKRAEVKPVSKEVEVNQTNLF